MLERRAAPDGYPTDNQEKEECAMSYAVLPAFLLGVLIAVPGEHACSTAYVDFVQRVSDRVDHLPAERLAALHRGGLRVFDACDSGHLQNPERKFRSLEQS